MNDGTLRTSADIGSETANAIAVVYKVDTNARKAYAVGKVLSDSSLIWAASNADGYSKNITDLQEENGYTDGSTGLAKLIAAAPDANTDLENMYPAWDYACNYGTKQGLDSFQTGWYLPSKQELQEVYDQRNNMPSSLFNFGTTLYWSSSQYASVNNCACELDFGSGSWTNYSNSNNKINNRYVCAVRAFTF